MLKKRNQHYLRAWLDAYYALQMKGRRDDKNKRASSDSTTSDDSVVSFDSWYLDEYLLEESEEMERVIMADESDGDGEAVVTPPGGSLPQGAVVEGQLENGLDKKVGRVSAKVLRQQWSQWGKGKKATGRKGHGLTLEAGSVLFGNVELWKRKPPDGKQQ